MLQFPEDYFKKKLQDGFVVGEVMKRVWAASVEVLQRVIDICEKHQLKYVVYWGTLLGAVRHKGFIPWDDDIDIALCGEDYVKFLTVARQELPEEYGVFNVYTEDGYTNAFTRITNGDTIDTREGRMAEYHNCPFSVGIDVFPLYYLPRDEQCAEQQKLLLTIIIQLYSMLQQREKMETDGANAEAIQAYSIEIAKKVLALQELTGYQMERGKNLKTQLCIVFDLVCRLYTEEESDYLTSFSHYMKNGYRLPKELFADSILMPFENIMVRVPKEYDKVLSRTYRNYMTPRRGIAGHQDVYFRGQMEDLINQLCLMEVNYDTETGAKQSERLLPENWQKKLYFTDVSGERIRKKVVLYSPTWVEILCNSGYSMDKLRKVLHAFQEMQDVVLWWFAYPLSGAGDSIIRSIAPELLEEYWQIVREYQQEGWGIYDDSCGAGRAIMWSDVYYGDQGCLCTSCMDAGKEVIFQKYEEIDVVEYEGRIGNGA